jgi:hypothetical protein
MRGRARGGGRQFLQRRAIFSDLGARDEFLIKVVARVGAARSDGLRGGASALLNRR